MSETIVRYKRETIEGKEYIVVMFNIDGVDCGGLAMPKKTWSWFHLALLKGLKASDTIIDFRAEEKDKCSSTTLN